MKRVAMRVESMEVAEDTKNHTKFVVHNITGQFVVLHWMNDGKRLGSRRKIMVQLYTKVKLNNLNSNLLLSHYCIEAIDFLLQRSCSNLIFFGVFSILVFWIHFELFERWFSMDDVAVGIQRLQNSFGGRMHKVTPGFEQWMYNEIDKSNLQQMINVVNCGN